VKIKISDIILAKNIVNNSNNGGSNNTTGSDGTKNSDVATTNDAIVDSSVPLSGLNINPFTDINESDWFYEDVLWGHEHDLFKGTSKTEFSPHLPMTRAMMVTVLGRLYGLTDITSDSPFTDMDGSSYYAPYVNWAHQTGIATGIGGGKFAPELPITRQDLAAILYRYEQHINKVPSGVIADKEFSDWSSVSDYAKIAVNSLTAQGIINGKSYNLFDPQGKATRAEVAAMLHRFVESIKEK
ncbi:MAG: S-layer homology domain-containing protein, partial [Firmicutes bacterium]|nr:S-layer homology domain-containing protein [Bacillota bacterium]